MIAYPNTRPMCSANCDGAAAAVVCSGETLKSLSLEQRRRAVKVSASVLTTDPYEEGCQVLPNVNTLTRKAATIAYEQAGVGPRDLDLVELHDCFATAELVHYDNLMLCDEGGAADFFNSGATWRDGSTPVNVSGGLESKGHPSRLPASSISGRSATTSAVRPATARSRMRRSASPTSSDSARLAACTSWRSRRRSPVSSPQCDETAQRLS
jgi:acetyl-CoA acetyltransferase